MPDDPLDKLLSLAAGPLGGDPSAGVGEFAGRHGLSLAAMLGRVNGFYAFESALHVFPSAASDRMSLELWNDPDLWRRDYDDLANGLVFFAEDIFGGQFVLADDGIGSFDPETGDVEVIAPDLVSWAAVVLGDYEMLTGYPIAHEWQVRHGALVEGQRLVPKLPFVTGGAFEVDNLYAADAVEGMRVRGNLAVQIGDLPDGAQISYRIVDPMSWTWKGAWDAINQSFTRLAADLRSGNDQFWWTCGHSENETFPFWAFASFNRAGVAGEEDVVISFSFKRVEGSLEFTSDLARGDGQLLAEGPSAVTSLADDVSSLRAWVRKQVEVALRFVEENHHILRAELC